MLLVICSKFLEKIITAKCTKDLHKVRKEIIFTTKALKTQSFTKKKEIEIKRREGFFCFFCAYK